MKKHFYLLVLALLVAGTIDLTAQSIKSDTQYPEVQVTHAKLLGTTPPLRTLVPMKPTTAERRKHNKDLKKTVPNFLGRKPTPPAKPGALPQGVDPVRQAGFNRNLQIPIEPIVNIDGMGENLSNVAPPDPCGDIGLNYYIQMVNATLFQVIDKEGNAVTAPIAANTLWSQIGFSSAGDPIILYDQEVDRWIITEFPFGNTLLFAITATNDPMGSWIVYNFSTPSFPDYPKYSIWNNAYCVTTNENGPSQPVSYFINREEILQGTSDPQIQRLTLPGVTGGPGFFVATPVDWTGQTPPPADAKPMILRLSDDAWGSVSTDDAIQVFEIDIDWDNPGNTSFTNTTVFTAPFDTDACAAPGFGFACIPQLNGGGIDGIPETIMHQTHYRNFGSHESMVLNFIVNAGGADIIAGIRWMELRRMPGENWTVFQEGTFAPNDGKHRFMGGICMDGNGNIGLAYSISSPNDFPGLGFTGRRNGDPPGEMTVDEFIAVQGTGPSNDNARFGDYAQLVIDPADDRTFWYTGQYQRNNQWATRIFSFNLGRDTIDIGPTALITPQNAPDLTDAETVQIRVKNFGIDTQTAFRVGYVFENEDPVFDTIQFVLAPDSFYTHTFTETVDMSQVGPYNFSIFTGLANDQAPLNDTLRVVRSKLSRFDAGITNIEGLDGLICETELTARLSLQNFGADTLTSVTVDVELNGSPFATIDWTGILPPGETELLDVVLNGFINGQNSVIAGTSQPNGMTDEIPANDGFLRAFNVIADGVSVFLNLLTDNWPDETTWELLDADGNLLFTGGPYEDDMTLYTEEFCLDPEACYQFTIFDAIGDGICCQFGEGNYSFTDASGNTLAFSDGVFGTSETLNFCATFECMMTADVDVSPESEDGASDGALLITQIDGVGPFQYSIDGGMTFQAENLFENLPAGEYDIVIMGEFDCMYEETVTLPLCALQATIQVTNETVGQQNGRIFIASVGNGQSPFQYSIDGGDTFQSNPLFAGLFMGDYEVVVRDAQGCETTITVTVDGEVSAKEFLTGQVIELFPNPTEGVIRINVKGLTRADVFLPVEVLNNQGQLMHVSNLTRYNDTYTGQVSLMIYPAGIYYIRFVDEKMNRMAKVVRQ